LLSKCELGIVKSKTDIGPLARECATNAQFRPDKPQAATGKSLIFLSRWLTLNQRVPRSAKGKNKHWIRQGSPARALVPPSGEAIDWRQLVP
jgi:hypothetical protein